MVGEEEAHKPPGSEIPKQLPHVSITSVPTIIRNSKPSVQRWSQKEAEFVLRSWYFVSGDDSQGNILSNSYRTKSKHPYWNKINIDKYRRTKASERRNIYRNIYQGHLQINDRKKILKRSLRFNLLSNRPLGFKFYQITPWRMFRHQITR
jgi:hypothetical protein